MNIVVPQQVQHLGGIQYIDIYIRFHVKIENLSKEFLKDSLFSFTLVLREIFTMSENNIVWKLPSNLWFVEEMCLKIKYIIYCKLNDIQCILMILLATFNSCLNFFSPCISCLSIVDKTMMDIIELIFAPPKSLSFFIENLSYYSEPKKPNLVLTFF